MGTLLLELRACVAFFTRIPVAGMTLSTTTADYLAHAPLVGATIGLFKSAVILSFALLFGDIIAVILGIIFALVLTGALHEDGFMDTCDGFALRHSRQRTIDIMRDPRAGAFAVIGIVALLGLRVALLHQLLHVCQTPLFIAVLTATHGLSRLAAIWPLATDEYVGGSGKSSTVAQRLSNRAKFAAWLWTVLGLTPAVVIAPQPLLIALPIAVLCYAGLRRLFLRRLGGYTGDCLGALQQTTEVVIYLAIAATLPAVV